MTMFNFYLINRNLPHDWKHATVTPIYKGKSAVNDIRNYRPISCTLFTGKIPESLLKGRLVTHFFLALYCLKLNLVFLPGRLISSNLLHTDHIIHKELHKGNSADVILFDLSKAFNTVSHSTLK